MNSIKNSELELVRELERVKKQNFDIENCYKLKISELEHQIQPKNCSETQQPNSYSDSQLPLEIQNLQQKLEELKPFLPSDSLLEKLSTSEIRFSYDELFENLCSTLEENSRLRSISADNFSTQKTDSSENQTLEEKFAITSSMLENANQKLEAVLSSYEDLFIENKRLLEQQEELVSSAVDLKCQQIEAEYANREILLKQYLSEADEKISLLEYNVTQYQQKLLWLETLNSSEICSKGKNKENKGTSDSKSKEEKETNRILLLEDELANTKMSLTTASERTKELSIRLSSLDFSYSKLQEKNCKLQKRLEENERQATIERESLLNRHQSQISELQEALRESRMASVTQFVQNNFNLREVSDEDSCSSDEERRSMKQSVGSVSLADEVKAIKFSLGKLSQCDTSGDIRKSLNCLKKIEKRVSQIPLRESVYFEQLKDGFEKIKLEKKEILAELIAEQKEKAALKEEITNNFQCKYCREFDSRLSQSLSAFEDLKKLYSNFKTLTSNQEAKNKETLSKYESELEAQRKEIQTLKSQNQSLSGSLIEFEQSKKDLEKSKKEIESLSSALCEKKNENTQLREDFALKMQIFAEQQFELKEEVSRYKKLCKRNNLVHN